MIQVLIIEDNDDKRQLINSIVIDCGIYEKIIDNVDNVSCAIKKMELTQYDIVILDMNLPIRTKGKAKTDSGISILKELDEGGLLVPRSIIGVTSYDDLKEKYSSLFQSFDFNLYSSLASDEWETALRGKINWLKKTQKSNERVTGKKVIVTVHGISTAGKWHESLEESLTKDDPNVICKKFEYKHISATKLMSPRVKRKIFSSFSSEIDALFTKYRDCEFYFFSHSFGTYLLGNKLKSLEIENTPKIKSVVLAGSVLKRNFPWCNIKTKLNINCIVNDCGVKDKALIASELLVPGFGMAGRTGFYTLESETLKNRYHDGKHSFFEEIEGFYSEYWLPILDGLVVKEGPNIKLGFWRELIENALDNIKLYFWIIILLIIIYLFVN